MKKKYLFSSPIFLFFIFFMVLVSVIHFDNVIASSDIHIDFGGGISALLYSNNEHIVTDGDNIAVVYAGYNGDPTFINMKYSVNDGGSWVDRAVRQTTNATKGVAIARDSNFNIHVIYSEYSGGSGTTYLFYKFFDWSIKLWCKIKDGDLSLPDDKGYNLSIGSWGSSFGGDIKLDADDNIHIVTQDRENTPQCDLLYTRYNSTSDIWDYTTVLDTETTQEELFKYMSIAIDSDNSIYCIYAKEQTDLWDKSKFYDNYLTTSTNGGNDWTTIQIINRTYPFNTQPSKLIIDNNNILHYMYSGNYTGSNNWRVGYGKSTDYGSTWTFLNVTDNDKHSSVGGLTKDFNNNLYFIYHQRNSITSGVEDWNLTGRIYINDVFGDEIQIVTGYSSYPNLVWSNIYNQFETIGIKGLYENREPVNFEIRLLEMLFSDFGTTPIVFDIIPHQNIYFWFDSVDIHITNWDTTTGKYRLVNATGIEIITPIEISPYSSEAQRFLISSNFGIGTWQLQGVRNGLEFTDPTVSLYNFTVNGTTNNYWIHVSDSRIPTNSFIGVEFQAFTGESYNITCYSTDIGQQLKGWYTSQGYTENRINNNPTAFFFGSEQDGSYIIYLRNLTTDEILASSSIFLVSDEPTENVYTIAVSYARLSYLQRQSIAIARGGQEPYTVYVIHEGGQLKFSATENIPTYTFTLSFTQAEIGIYTIHVFDEHGEPGENRAEQLSFVVYDPSAPTGDEVVDLWIGVADWIKAIIGAIIVLGFTFMPLIIVGKMEKINFKIEVPSPVYAISGGVGVVVSTMFGLWGWEVAFFICVIAIIVTVISYVWQEKSD